MSDLLRELADLIEASGGRITFDARRYARAAQSWPDYLPPMFGPESVAVERWGMSGWDGMWIVRSPEHWPTPTVEIGQVWEQKPSSIATWEEAERSTGWLSSVEHTIVRIAGERFENQCGTWLPWSMINAEHWRLVRAAPGSSP